MIKNSKALSIENEKLKLQVEEFRLQLIEAKESIYVIKTGNIDALVVANNKNLKVYTEKTSDITYRILFEKMHEGALILNQEGSVIFCNACLANMVSKPLSKVIGTKFKSYVDESSLQNYESLFKSGWIGYVNEEVNIITNGDRTLPVLMSVNSFKLDNLAVLSIILTDLTIQNKNQAELKRKTDQLEQKNKELENANKDLTSFTNISSHDLQEPLRKIQTFVTCIMDDEEVNLSENGKGYFRKLKNAAKRMQTLIEDLLTYSRTRNVIDNIFKNTNLNTVMDSVLIGFEDIILEKNAIIEIMPLGNSNIITFQFRQLFYNLISNSLKFSIKGTPPHITVRSELIPRNKSIEPNLLPELDYLHLIITDNGIGFDPQYKDRIFEVFQRLHSQTEYEGTGIGLAICKRIIENHNGIITAYGEINKGAQVDIYLPV